MNKLIKSMYSCAIYLFLYLPILVLMVFSMNRSEFSFRWEGFTFDWYRAVFHDIDLLQVAGHSLWVAIVASTLASILGFMASISLYKYRYWGKRFFSGLILILIILPDIVMGIALLVLFSHLKVKLGFFTLLIAHVTFCFPFVSVVLLSRMSDLNKHIFEAAKDLGSTDWYTVTRVFAPLLMPAIISGWLLSFTLSFDDVIISYFVTGPGFQTLPLRIFSMVKVGVNPEINALCSLIFLLTISLVFTAHYLFNRSNKDKRRVIV